MARQISLPSGEKRWVAEVERTLPDGSVYRAVGKRFRTRREAEEWRRQQLERLDDQWARHRLGLTAPSPEAQNPTTNPTTPTVEEWGEIFFAHRDGLVAERRLSPTTIASDHSHWAHIVENMGDLPLDKVTGDKIDAFKAKGGKSVHQRLTVLSAALTLAVRRRVIPYNPISEESHLARADVVPLPVRFHAIEDVVRILQAWPRAAYPREYIAVALAGLAGLREEEVRALRPQDVILTYAEGVYSVRGKVTSYLRGVIHIRQAVVRKRGGGWVEKPPKNGLPRKIPVCPTLAGILRPLLDQARPLLLADEDGNVFDGNGSKAPLQRLLRKVQEDLAIERRTFHELRKSAVNWWRRAGVGDGELARWLGHPGELPAVTRRHYLEAGAPEPDWIEAGKIEPPKVTQPRPALEVVG